MYYLTVSMGRGAGWFWRGMPHKVAASHWPRQELSEGLPEAEWPASRWPAHVPDEWPLVVGRRVHWFFTCLPTYEPVLRAVWVSLCGGSCFLYKLVIYEVASWKLSCLLWLSLSARGQLCSVSSGGATRQEHKYQESRIIGGHLGGQPS